MQPDLELVAVRRDESFKVWSHGYPYRTVRWHFHPEYEIHLIVATTGKIFVGDHIGRASARSRAISAAIPGCRSCNT